MVKWRTHKYIINDVFNVDYINILYISDSLSSGEKWIIPGKYLFMTAQISHISRHCF